MGPRQGVEKSLDFLGVNGALGMIGLEMATVTDDAVFGLAPSGKARIKFDGASIVYSVAGGAWTAFGGSGTITGAASVGASGIAVYDGVTSNTINIRKIHAASSKLSAVLNGQMVDLDVVEANLTLTNIGGTLTLAKGGTGATTQAGAMAAISPLTTKGDLLAFSTLSSRLPVGVDGRVLTADSTQAFGLRWATPGVGSITGAENVGLGKPLFSTINGTLLDFYTLDAGSSKVTVTAAASNVVKVDVVEANLTLGNIGGLLPLAKLATGTDAYVITMVGGVPAWAASTGGGSGADALGTYIVQTATNKPTNAQVLAALTTGIVKNTTTTGVLSIAAAGTDYEVPITFAGLLSRATNTVSLTGGTNGQYLTSVGTTPTWTAAPSIPSSLATYIVQTATNKPTNAQVLAALTTGLLKSTTTTGVLSIAASGTDYELPLTFGGLLSRAANAVSISAGTANQVITTIGGVAAWSSVVLANTTGLLSIDRLSPSGGTEAQTVTLVGGVPTWSDALYRKWSQLDDPDQALVLAMGTNTTSFSWTGASGSATLFRFRNDGSHTGTGYLVSIDTASASSTIKPFRVRVNSSSDVISIDNTGLTFFSKEVRFNGSTSGYSGIKAAATTASVTYTWPSAAPAVDGYVLSSTTAGAWSWVAQGGGVAGSVKWNAITAPDGNLSLSMAANTTTFTHAATGSANLWTWTDSTTNSSASGYLATYATTTGSTLKPFRVQARGTTYLDVLATGEISIGATAPVSSVGLTVGGAIRLNGQTYTFPSSPGTSGYVLSTNGSGTLSWAPDATGGVAGSVAWSGITAPTTNLSLSMANWQSTFTSGNATGDTDIWTWTDSATNNDASGYLVTVKTTTGSTMNPFRVQAKGLDALLVDPTGFATVQVSDTGTTNVLTALKLVHGSSGTAGDQFGVGVDFYGKTSRWAAIRGLSDDSTAGLLDLWIDIDGTLTKVARYAQGSFTSYKPENVQVTNSATNTITESLGLYHVSTTPASVSGGFGTQLSFYGSNTSGSNVRQGYIQTSWNEFEDEPSVEAAMVIGLRKASADFGVLYLNGVTLTIVSDVLPASNDTYAMGGSSNKWSDVWTVLQHTGDLELGFPDSPGEWLIREGAEHIYLLNKRNGKHYRTVMEECPADEFPQVPANHGRPFAGAHADA